jgi:CDP-4-dehydro-6-deoxyglucose reductase
LNSYLRRLLGRRGKDDEERFEPYPIALAATDLFDGTVAHRRHLTPDTLELGVALPDGADLDYAPGQYLNLVLPEGREPGMRRELRSYSIFSHPAEEGPLRIIAKLIPDGRATTWLSALEPGAPVSFEAPIGSFTLRRPLLGQLAFIATGTGVVPLRSMIYELIEERGINSGNVTLLHGVRTESDLFHVDEFRQWESDFSTFNYVPTLSQAHDDWDGACGWVTEHLGMFSLFPEKLQVYLCGNGAMVDDAIQAFDQKGVSRQSGRVYCEKFFDSSKR